MRLSILLALVPTVALATHPAPTPPTASPTATATATATSTATSGGNQLSVNEARQAPALGQGSFAIQGCQVAGNAGGSSTGGGAFLGFAFTTQQCYDMQLAQAYQALGAYAAACEVLNASPAGQRAAKRGVKLPVCSPPDRVTPPPPVNVNVEAAQCDLSGVVKKSDMEAALTDEQKAREKKILEKCVSK